MLLTSLASLSAALAAPVVDIRRTYADQTVQERWTWDDTQAPENLVSKEWFHQGGQRSRLEEYASGVLHGQVNTWDQRGVLQTERHFADGELHGVDREWSGPDSDRWVVVERNHQYGVPHGLQLRRGDADTVLLRHSYLDGQLHGRQQAWHPGGEMRYELSFDRGVLHGEQRLWDVGDLDAATEMTFVQGRPDGSQRYFTDSHWQTETWVDGRWEDVQSWHVEDEIPDAVHIYELDTRALAYHREAMDTGPPPPAQALYLSSAKSVVVERRHWPDGTLKEERERIGDRRYRRWAGNGQLVVEGLGNPSDRRGRWTEWRPDGTLHREEAWEARREGLVRIFDRKERVREVQTWAYDRTRWDIVLYDGDVRIGEGELRPHLGRHRWGTWTWFRPDGTVKRTEQYGHGPYSGNRPYVVDSEELSPDGSVRCTGDERNLRCVTPEDDGGSEELSVVALHRPRNGYDVYEPERLSFRRLEVERKALSDQAVVVPVLDGEGLVRVRRRLDASGAVLREEKWRRDGTRESVQGTTATGPWTEKHDRSGVLVLIEESLGGGATCSLMLDEGRVSKAWVTEADGSVVATGQGRPADRRIQECPLWGRHPELGG
jgi:antitoxin component YwqK of YwqJK toxin-antitoxin module